MDVNAEKIKWHFETLPPATKKALDLMSKKKWLKNSSWYLAGGTALALQVGNRRSFDLDFFTENKSFENSDVLRHFTGEKSWAVSINRPNTVYGNLCGAKMSFIALPFFVPAAAPLTYGTIRVLNARDIAVMKIIAVSQRGRKRDFFDLYWCANNLEPLESLISRLEVQYPSIEHNYHHIIKALLFFEDAESDPDPEIFFKADWKTVKAFFRAQVKLISARLLK